MLHYKTKFDIWFFIENSRTLVLKSNFIKFRKEIRSKLRRKNYLVCSACRGVRRVKFEIKIALPFVKVIHLLLISPHQETT